MIQKCDEIGPCDKQAEFININDSMALDGHYCLFCKVYLLDFIFGINNAEPNSSDKLLN